VNYGIRKVPFGKRRKQQAWWLEKQPTAAYFLSINVCIDLTGQTFQTE
jgi:hypothetical protein